MQLKSGSALANLERIAEMDGIDALLIEPSDLAVALDHLGDFRHPEVQAAMRSPLRTNAATRSAS